MRAGKSLPLMPKLRFPEFRRSPWQSTGSLGDVLALEYGSALPEKARNGGEVPVVGSNGVIGYHDEALIPGPAVVIGRKGSVGQVNWVDRACYPIDTTYYVSLLNPRQITLRYLYRLLEAMPLKDLTDPGAVPGLNRNAVYGLAVVLPEKAEQQKIVACLGSLDDLIGAEGRTLEALRQHKQGLMQQLFPQADETVPRLRFPEFRDAGEWEEKELGDVSEVLMCKRIFASETNPNGGVPFYKIGTLGGVPDAFISKDLFEEYRSKYNFPRTGEILITCSGTVGKCLPYNGIEAYFQDSNIVWIDNPTLEVSNEFLLSILSNVNWSVLNSTTITRIYGPDLRGLAIKFPKNKREQKRIADGLSALDTRIRAQVTKLDTLRAHKQGLLQQLFPDLEEEPQ